MARGEVTSIAKSYCQKWAELSTHALARKLIKEHPKFFNNYEAARSAVRYHRGESGELNRSKLKERIHKKPVLPISHKEDYTPYEIKSSKILILSDIHIPYQDNDALELAISYGLDKGANCVLLNGDVLDFAAISRHDKDWRHRTVAEEFEFGRQFLDYLRFKFPSALIIWKDGNHDERWEKYLYTKAPEIFDDSEFRLPVRLRFGEYGVQHLTDKRPIKIGKLTVLHGHELAGGSGGVNPARATFLKTLHSVLVGHYHKTSSHTEATLDGSIISVESQGCLCGMNPSYMPINKWNLGFSYVELNVKTGEYILQNKRIIKGKVF